jgi:uncharacterized protein (TIGR02996 family)
MNERDLLLLAIAAQPDEDAPRLAFADYADEHNDPGHAAFIRAQVGLAGSNSDDPRRADWQAEQQRWLEEPQHRVFQRTERDRWLGGITRYAPGGCWRFERGFPTELDLRQRGLGLEGVLALIECPHLATVTKLDLDGNNIGSVGTAVLAWSRNPTCLRELNLSANDIADDGVMALASSPFLGSLRKLALAENSITGVGARALASARSLAGLTDLDLSEHEGISCADAEAILLSRHLCPELTLSISRFGINEDEVEMMNAKYGNRVFTG